MKKLKQMISAAAEISQWRDCQFSQNIIEFFVTILSPNCLKKINPLLFKICMTRKLGGRGMITKKQDATISTKAVKLGVWDSFKSATRC
jgi:hypothetical protein